MLVLVECKNYTHSVPVDDVEEFFTKVQQVAAANVKAVMASTAPFQSGTMQFAKSKGIGLLRYFDGSDLKWVLRRAHSAKSVASSDGVAAAVHEGLSSANFRSEIFSLYIQTPSQQTNSLWVLLEDLVRSSSLTSAQAAEIANPPVKRARRVRFVTKRQLEERAAEVLAAVGYAGRAVPLDAICDAERRQHGLSVILDAVPPSTGPPKVVLGRISFDPLQIIIYKQADPNFGRERFTLAHELAHHLLGHSRHLLSETYDAGDLLPDEFGQNDDANGRGNLPTDGLGPRDAFDIERLEFQANHFASTLLMPREPFVVSFGHHARDLDIMDAGFGALYVDSQPCNIRSYREVTSRLMLEYGVSRAAVRIRLKDLGILHEGTTEPARLPGRPTRAQH